jgi:predicted nucleotidyltransferase
VEPTPLNVASPRPADRVEDKAGRSIDMRPVGGLLHRMISRWHPEQIWLFGSRARGVARSDSDWDFLVVVPDEIPDGDLDPLLAWRLQKDAQVPADIVPCRASDFGDFRNTPNTLFFEVSKSRVVVYQR